MNPYEGLRRAILTGSKCNPTGCVHYRPNQLAMQFGIQERHACEILESLVADRIIYMAKWDGERECPFEEWPSAGAFWDALDNYVRIRLLARGAELLHELPKSSIGFSPSAS
jgi:hypothetical protein